ncbi:MAG: lysine decarboxylase [Chloroflexia bacterium]|nr:lysine decarboxylase [Chloroflexia bacterium]
MLQTVAVPAAHAPARSRSAASAHQRSPVIDALRAFGANGTVPFSTPGHKLGAGLDRDLHDLLGSRFCASDVWLNTADHDRTVRQAENLAAQTWGAERSFFLVNGSSSGNQAFLLATVAPGDEVVVARDLHQSLLAAFILTGARPIYVAPRLHPSLQLGLGMAAEDVAATLDAHPAAKLVVVTSPTYWGVASNLREIAIEAHTRGVAVYVDEAWGPHFGFHPGLPPSAMSSGADGAVTSPHKLLTGLSQAALLNVRGPRVSPARVANTVKLTQTTSPLMPILASLDACRRQMALHGEEMLERTIQLAGGARAALGRLPGIDVLDASRLGLPPEQYDPTRLVIDVQGRGLSGYLAETLLRERFGIAPEMSDTAGIVCLVTVSDTPETVQRLIRAVASLPHRSGSAAVSACPRVAGEAIAPGQQALTPREAYFARTRAVPLARAAGEIAAEAVIPYPPGIPVLTPGEIISDVKLNCLREGLASGMHIRGAADSTLETVRVVSGL